MKFKVISKQTLYLVSALIGALVVGCALFGVVAVVKFDHTHAKQKLVLGASFSDSYTRELGLDPLPTLEALLRSMPIKHLRLMSYWNEIEPEPGSYDFSSLDGQLALAKKYGASVSLAIGLRQPRYPECHPPDWEKQLTARQQQAALLNYEKAVIKHVAKNTTITSWQLENEAENSSFGQCPKFDRTLLKSEYSQLKQLDSSRPIIMNASDEVGLPLGAPRGDEVGLSIYRKYYLSQWKRYVSYPIPAWFERLRAALIETYTHRPVVIHELQAEPWGPDAVEKLSIAEQNKTMDAAKLEQVFGFAKATGIKQIDFWGAEWWYYRLVKLHDPSVWNEAKQIFLANN